MDLFIWGGPVTSQNIASVKWERPTNVIVLNEGFGGIGSSAFAALAQSLGPNPIRRLMQERGIGSADRIGIGGYSAFHGFANVVLASDDGPMVDAGAFFDAYFVSSGDQRPKAGYLVLARRAARGDALMVVTTSSNAGPGHDAGDASFSRLASQLDLRREAPVPGVPAPEEMLGDGNFAWANYGFSFTHADHANKLAAPWLNATMVPYLAGSAPLPGGLVASRWRTAGKVAVAVAGAVGVGLLAYEAAA